ncbi:MAG: winged helix-turn-helix transcriptional regulator [Nanoarchaeota archaeon]|nr:winged helix-turn-helix transcriptional regulator [Nanoarchaeota archaeon]
MLDYRRAIFASIKKNQGCHFRDLERRMAIPASTLKYHLNYMARKGIVQEKRSDNRICYFSGDIAEGDRALLSLIRQESFRRIILCILERKEANQKSIREYTSLSSSSVSWYLKRLEESKVITHEEANGEKYYKLLSNENSLMHLLITYKESFLDKLVDRVVEMWDS